MVGRGGCYSTVGLGAVVAVAVGVPIVGEAITTAVVVVIIIHDILNNLPPPIRRCSFAYYVFVIPNAVAGDVKILLTKTVSLVEVGGTLLGSGGGSCIDVKVWAVVAVVPIGRRECC